MRLRNLIFSAIVAAGVSTPVLAQQTLTVAIVGEPNTLDPMVSTKDLVSIVTQHFYETLYTFNSSWEVVPLLAKTMPEISEDGKTYRIALRQGVTFHDGSDMDSADVAASLQRWLKVASRGKGVADRIDSVVAEDANTLVINLNQAYAPLLSLLAFSNSAAAIFPEEILGDTLKATIGTGPYKLASHKPDQYIQLTRFDGYQSRTEASDGGSGARNQVADEIRFVPVADASTRVEGLLSGQFDFADGLPTEAIDRIEQSDKAEPVLLRPFGWPILAFNHKDGLLVNQDVRLAVQAAISPQDMLYAAFGDERFFVADGALYPKGWVWNSEAGTKAYGEADASKAANYLKSAKYDGTELRILTSHQYEFHFKMAEVAKVYLEAAGFKVKLDVVDWATLGQRRNNPELWDIYITHSPFLPEPSLTSMYHASSRLGWSNPQKDAVLASFNSTSDPAKRVELFKDLQRLVFEQGGFIKIGGFNALMGKRKGLTGISKTPWPYFWNAKTL
ncbi:peptide ABC transporter ['Osedax' symbiont bacterium Rs2_46_30_T18]|nr:peptide ABC transporter ['Osedax' symbiont bacterium Rs2_46_30_T18]